jgi:hypothetical protein
LPVTWASLTPGIATVSSSGAVTAVAAGPAIIQALVSGITGLDTLPVVAPANIAFANFNDGTPGPYAYLGTPGPVDYPNDPTGSGRGKVNRIFYSVPATFQSNDVNMELNTSHHYRYGETIWFKGDLYIPSTLSDGVTPKTTLQNNDRRKLIDYFTVGGARMILETSNMTLLYVAGDGMTGTYHEDIYLGSTGITLLNDTWYTIEMKMVTNSADNVRDGVLEIYVNNPTSTPSFSVTSGLGWITEHYAGGTYFSSFRFGTQLTTYGIGEGAYSEYRYWDNVGFSTTRIGQ